MLVPTASIAERVIAPDDPKVALELATRLLADGRLMANHHRGLWGYSGTARGDGRALTIQSSGIGAQAARGRRTRGAALRSAPEFTRARPPRQLCDRNPCVRRSRMRRLPVEQPGRGLLRNRDGGRRA